MSVNHNKCHHCHPYTISIWHTRKINNVKNREINREASDEPERSPLYVWHVIQLHTIPRSSIIVYICIHIYIYIHLYIYLFIYIFMCSICLFSTRSIIQFAAFRAHLLSSGSADGPGVQCSVQARKASQGACRYDNWRVPPLQLLSSPWQRPAVRDSVVYLSLFLQSEGDFWLVSEASPHSCRDPAIYKNKQIGSRLCG